ncbi:hypothetical protein [Arsenicibacter rosenii]|uniref:hypothetical protein n=1 Tax=Arsenicibacter rosenii TaxID=1750698 RepID=UPI0009F2CFCB|nr:hypothetical protein [Arsenicibacter rosenii]
MIRYATLLLPVLVFSYGCQQADKKQQTDTADTQKPATTCYRLVTGQDTVSMQLTTKGSDAEGALTYNFYEKDRNQGTFTGTFHGDTLLANYTFQSEGTQSIREVAFLRQGDELVEGYSDMEDQNGKFVFTDKATISFTEGIRLKKESCR